MSSQPLLNEKYFNSNTSCIDPESYDNGRLRYSMKSDTMEDKCHVLPPYRNDEISKEDEILVFTCEEKISTFSKLLTSKNSDLINHFEDLIQRMSYDVRKVIMKKRSLEHTFAIDKRRMENQIHQLEKEREISQISSLENIQVITNMKIDIHNLQKKVNILQVQLSVAQTECSVIRSENVTMKQEYDVKMLQLQHEVSSRLQPSDGSANSHTESWSDNNEECGHANNNHFIKILKDDTSVSKSQAMNTQGIQTLSNVNDLPESGTDVESLINPGHLTEYQYLTESSSTVDHIFIAFRSFGANKASHSKDEGLKRDSSDNLGTNLSIKNGRHFKVKLAGATSVGKSTYMQRLCTDKFNPTCRATTGMDFQNKIMKIDGNLVDVQLWDTSGEERFHSLSSSYYRGADGVLLLYDCTRPDTFLYARNEVETIMELVKENIPIILVANKDDLANEKRRNGKQVVDKQDGITLAKERNLIFAEASAKNGLNVHLTLETLTRKMIETGILSSSEDKVCLKKDMLSRKASRQCCK